MNRLRVLAAAGMLSLLALCGCTSKYVQASVRNQSGGTVTLVEVGYPSASFGTEALADGAVFNYRFKIIGSGSTKVQWTDAKRVEHTAFGPNLVEGQQGRLTLTLMANGASWDKQLTR